MGSHKKILQLQRQNKMCVKTTLLCVYKVANNVCVLICVNKDIRIPHEHRSEAANNVCVLIYVNCSDLKKYKISGTLDNVQSNNQVINQINY